jgi:hypothetical protein
VQTGAVGGWSRPGGAGAPWIGFPRAAGRRGATGRPWRLRGGPGSGAEPPVGSPEPTGAQGGSHHSGAPGHAGQGRQVQGDQVRDLLGDQAVGGDESFLQLKQLLLQALGK